MLIDGKEKLERMRDGRAIYIGAERVNDVTPHPAFRNGAQTIAGLYELKADPRQRDLFSFEENGERYGLLLAAMPNARRPRAAHAGNEGDRRRNLRSDRRSPDHVAGLITGLAMKPALLEACGRGLRRRTSCATTSIARARTTSISRSR